MLLNPTLDQLHQLGLAGMAKAFNELADHPDAQTLDHAAWLGLLLDRELTARQDRRLQTRLRAAKLRYPQACINAGLWGPRNPTREDIDFAARRDLDRRVITELAAGHWLRDHHHLVLCGACGCGKTWLACALGHQAIRLDRSVLYYRLPRLFAELALAHGDGRYPRLFRALCRADLLILDDFGPETMTAPQRRDLLEVFEERYGRASTLVTSQLPVERWYDVIAEPIMADAILDRLVHNAHELNLKGDSLRKRAAAKLDDQPNS